jgi:hypothetical protein
MSSVTFKGYLFAVLAAVGTRSEGPVYFLQEMKTYKDLKDIHVIRIKKKTNMWQEDPGLHPFLGKKVVIEGTITDDELDYTSVKPL